MVPFAVSQTTVDVGLVNRDPQLHPIAELLEAEVRVISELCDNVIRQPTALVLQTAPIKFLQASR